MCGHCELALCRPGEVLLLLTYAWPILTNIWLQLGAHGEPHLPWQLAGYAWPSGSTLTFLFKAVLGGTQSQPPPFVLTCDTTGCESLLLASRAGQDELAALGS